MRITENYENMGILQIPSSFVCQDSWKLQSWKSLDLMENLMLYNPSVKDSKLKIEVNKVIFKYFIKVWNLKFLFFFYFSVSFNLIKKAPQKIFRKFHKKISRKMIFLCFQIFFDTFTHIIYECLTQI